MKITARLGLFALLSLFLFTACSVYNIYDVVQTTKVASKTIKGFSPKEDIKLGKSVSLEFEKDKVNYPILSKADHPEAYAYIDHLVQTILASDEIEFKDKFPWEVKIIEKNVLNAFALPGGYIYVYTGLIEFLETESELIGVLGHEIAHSDRRHAVRQFRKSVGVSYLLQATLGNAAYVQSFSNQLLNLEFSRNYEKEADEFSVRYLCSSQYHATGAAGFFEKLEAKGGERSAQFLSTHPLPGNRVEDIHKQAAKRNCQDDPNFVDNYEAKKQLFR
jgi:Putative Zn-dependent protease, contains TPR repeats